MYICCFALTLRPQWVQHLNAFRVEAAWKLGQWEGLEQCLKAVRSVLNNRCMYIYVEDQFITRELGINWKVYTALS